MKSLSFRLLLFAAAVSATFPQVFGLDLVPDHVSCQSGGGMGIASLGTGWCYGPHDHWETEIFFGLVPRYDSGSAKASVAVKENYVPWRIQLGRGFTLEPLTTGIYFTTLISRKFWLHQPDRYPSGYYVLSTKIRTNISIGQRLRYDMPKRSRVVDSISAYYEIGTCDLYALNAIGNHKLKPHDWLQLCLGIRVHLKK